MQAILRRVVLASFCFLAPTAGRSADEPAEPLDAQQREIIATVTDKIIGRIGALKATHPELEKFGEPPFFKRDPGGFHYDYKLDETATKDGQPEARALAGGYAIYFRLAAVGTPSDEPRSYSSFSVVGGARAGIAFDVGLSAFETPGTAEPPADSAIPGLDVPPRDQAIYQAINHELETTFEQLAAEYLLRKNGIALDLPTLLAAGGSKDATVSESAMTVLRFRSLTAEQLAQIRAGFSSGRFPIGTTYTGIKIIEDQDNDHLPEFYRDLVAALLHAEVTGADKLERTCFFGQSSDSAGRKVRGSIIWGIAKRGDTRHLAVAKLMLTSDPVAKFRVAALDYIAKLDGEEPAQLVIAAVADRQHSVQARATELAGEKHLRAAIPALRLAAQSPSPLIRANAVAALGKLGEAGIPSAPRQVPESAREMVAALRRNGLADAEIIQICGSPTTFVSLPEDAPVPANLPRGIEVDEFHTLHLKDRWRMTALDQKSIRKRARQYELGLAMSRFQSSLDPTGPFLLAAALKAKDEESAVIIYGRMSGERENDAEALRLGITGMAWNRLLKGLDAYWRKNDPTALAALGAVVKLKPFATPGSLLDAYVAQSAALISEITARAKQRIGPQPKRTDEAAYIRYWVRQIREINGYQIAQPGEPMIWYEQCKPYSKIRCLLSPATSSARSGSRRCPRCSPRWSMKRRRARSDAGGIFTRTDTSSR